MDLRSPLQLGAHAKRHPASLQDSLGPLDVSGLKGKAPTVPMPEIDRDRLISGSGVLWKASCGRDPTAPDSS